MNNYPQAVEVCDMGRVTVTSNVGGLSLANLAITVNPRLRKLSVLNVGANNIYINRGAASATSYVIQPGEGLTVTITLKAASELRFFTNAGESCDMNWQQEGSL